MATIITKIGNKPKDIIDSKFLYSINLHVWLMMVEITNTFIMFVDGINEFIFIFEA